MFLMRYPWQVLCAALMALCVFLGVSNSNLRSTLTEERAEWKTERDNAAKAKRDAETKAREAANNAQKAYEQLSKDDSPVVRYIERNRVQVCPAAAGAVKSDAAAIPQVTPAAPIVAISEPDIRACDSAYVYAKSAYDFGQDLIAKGLAE